MQATEAEATRTQLGAPDAGRKWSQGCNLDLRVHAGGRVGPRCPSLRGHGSVCSRAMTVDRASTATTHLWPHLLPRQPRQPIEVSLIACLHVHCNNRAGEAVLLSEQAVLSCRRIEQPSSLRLGIVGHLSGGQSIRPALV
ncbi:unnamed protein product [Protopolystoma xenopodis]|uniref:Uncharacterized protein n=1 Tax=Protopolystoma xenopodis TaxID=117903 RepID=A0A448WGZ8_9PLAT|nr:unnamed protein product [Protopolystoma xenopodis]